MTTATPDRERVNTLTSEKMLGLIESTHKHKGLSFLFGETGRGKTFTAQYWLSAHPDCGWYLRCDAGESRAKLVRKLCREIGGLSTSSNKYSFDGYLNPILSKVHGGLLIVDEANYLLGGSQFKAEETLNFFRDLYDLYDIGVLMIFTSYRMSDLKTGRLGSFLEQFRGRQHLNLELPARILRDSEVRKIVEAYVSNPADAFVNAAAEIAAQDDGKIRTLFKYLDHLKLISASEKKDYFTASALRSVAKRYADGGEWPEN